MSLPLKRSMERLTKAVRNSKNPDAAAFMQKFASLLESPAPGNVLNIETAALLVTVYERDIQALYAAVVPEAIEWSTTYFLSLMKTFKRKDHDTLWQRVAAKGIVDGLLIFLQDTEDACAATHVTRPFVTALCQILAAETYGHISSELRSSAGKFLTGLITGHADAKTWVQDPKNLGIDGLSRLFVTARDFCVLDPCLEMVTRLAPKRDPKARTEFFRSIIHSSASKATFGEDACKKILEILFKANKARTWFEISDLLFEAMAVNSRRPQRFVLKRLEVAGMTYPENAWHIRLFLDARVTLSVVPFNSEGEEMLETTYENIMAMRFTETEGDSCFMEWDLHLPPTFQNTGEAMSQKDSRNIKLLASRTTMDNMKVLLRRHGKIAEEFDAPRNPKQSLSRAPMELDQSKPLSPLAVENKQSTIKSFYVSSETSQSEIELATQPILYSPHRMPGPIIDDTAKDADRLSTTYLTLKEREAGSVLKISMAKPRVGLIEDTEDEPTPESRKDNPPSKRKASYSMQADEDESPPVFKRARLVSEVGSEGEVSRSAQDASSSAFQGRGLTNKKLDGSTGFPLGINVTSRPNAIGTMSPARLAGRSAREVAVSVPIGGRVSQVIAAPRSDHGAPRKIDLSLPAITTKQSRMQAIKDNSKKAIWESENFSQLIAQKFGPPQANALEMKGKSVESQVFPESPRTMLPDEQLPNDEIMGSPVVELQDGFESAKQQKAARYQHEEEQNELAAHPPTNEARTEEEPSSSPIKPGMVLKRQLRDAMARASMKGTKIISDSSSDDHMGGRGADRSIPRTPKKAARPRAQPEDATPLNHQKTSKFTGEMFGKFTFGKTLPQRDTQKASHVNWAKPIQFSQDEITTKKASKIRYASKYNKEQPRTERAALSGLKASKGLPRFKARVPAKPNDESDSSGDEDGSEKSETEEFDSDELTQAMSRISDAILNRYNARCSGLRREARLRRDALATKATNDLSEMHGDYDRSSERFMILDETCGNVMQEIVGRVEDLRSVNDKLTAHFEKVLERHDRSASASRLSQPLIGKPLPDCLRL